MEDIFDSISKNKSSACIENVSVLHQELLDANSHVAYCIFTSGSTGKPKGVMISHASACDFYDAFEEVMLISESSVCLNTSEMHFDVSFMDLFFPLYKGSCLHVMPGRVTARRLLSLIEECGITHFTAVSSLLTMITKSSYFESINSSSVQRIMTGAEILNKTTIEKWLKKNRQALIVNGYGPTETTVICTWFLIMYAQLNCYKSFPIGTALDGTVADILVDGTISKNLNVEGELIISGPQVMLGYMDDEQQTARSMLYANGRKYYRTGDICKKDSSNILHVLGRIDHEVKVSGFRVHLSEVKRVLEAVDFVKEVMVCTNKGSEGETIIVAALVFDRGYTSAGTKLSELNGLVEQQLPYYMIPTHIVEFKELPKLNNGKVDVKLIEKNIEATHRTNTLSY